MPSRALPESPGAFPLPMPAQADPSLDLIQSGWSDFDAMRPLRPGCLTLLDAPGDSDLVDRLYADAAVQGRVVLVADGANSVDAYRLATAGRRRALARLGPDAPRRELAAYEELTLDRVRVARGFTVHQLQAIVEDELPREAERAAEEGFAVGLVAAPGLLSMSLDVDVQRDEARVLAERAVRSLRALAKRLDAPVLVTGGILLPGTVHPLRALLESQADEVVTVRERVGATVLDFPRRGARFVVPAGSQRRIDEFAPGAADERPRLPMPRPAPIGVGYMRGRLWGPRYGPAAAFIHGPRVLLEEPAVTAGAGATRRAA